MSAYKYEDGLVPDRLYTRFLTPGDIEPWMAFFADKESIQYFPWVENTTDLERSRQWIEKQFARYKENRYGLQALIRKDTDEFIGQCGLLKQDVNGTFELEVGYHIFRKFWGNGYAPEAAKAFFDYGLKNDQADSLISIIDINNLKSQRVAEKNGLVREKQIHWMGMDIYVYRMPNPVE